MKRVFVFKEILVLAILLAALFSGGCSATSDQSGIKDRTVLRTWHTATNTAYTISPGDKLEIKFIHHPDFTETQRVRPDGGISLPLVHEVQCAGKRPSQLAEELISLYSKELRNLDIIVILRESVGQVAYIGGEVQKPQMISILAPTTVYQAVLRCGGLLSTANDDSVLILRARPDASPEALTVDLAAIRNGEVGDIMLAPYDVVHVPKTAIAHVGDFVQQYINRIIPQSIHLAFTYEIRSDVDFP